MVDERLGRQPQQRAGDPDCQGEAARDPRPPPQRGLDPTCRPPALQQAGGGEAGDAERDDLAEHHQAPVGRRRDGADREPGDGRHDPVVQVRLPVDDEPLDAGDVGRHVEVASGQRTGLGVVEVTRERAALEGVPYVFHGSSGTPPDELAEAVSYGVVKVNVDTDAQYAFTRAVADHVLTRYEGVLRVDGRVGDKDASDPRAWGLKGEAAMAARVAQACEELGSAGRSIAMGGAGPAPANVNPAG